MKKFLAAVVLSFVALGSVIADDGFACGVWFGFPEETAKTSVGGVAIGLPVVQFKNLSGTSLAFCGNVSERTTGCQIALIGFNKAQSMDGVQVSMVNLQEKQHGDYTVQVGFYNQTCQDGIQIGAINNARDNASFQLGLINVNKNGWLPVMIFVNFGKNFFD